MIKNKQNKIKNTKKILTVAGITGATLLGAFATKKAYDLYIKNLIDNTIYKIKNS